MNAPLVIEDPDALINAEWEDQQVGTPEFEDRVIATLTEEYETNGLEILVKLIKLGLMHDAAGTLNSISGHMDMGECAAEIIDELRMNIARQDFQAKCERYNGERF